MHRVVLVSLLFSLQGSMAFSQKTAMPNKAEGTLQIQQVRPGITNQEDRSPLELTRRIFASPEKLQMDNAMLTSRACGSSNPYGANGRWARRKT